MKIEWRTISDLRSGLPANGVLPAIADSEFHVGKTQWIIRFTLQNLGGSKNG